MSSHSFKQALSVAFFIFLCLSARADWQKDPVQTDTTLRRAYMVSNAHLDSQWNWDIQTTINEYVPKTLYRNLMLMEKYPGYIFNCEGGFKHSLMKEYYPEAFEKLKPYVSEGRWHISGASWEASDANVPSTESFVRNIMYGQHFYESEFGVVSTDIFLPDCFGFGWQLPSIAAHCGLIGFSTQKLWWKRIHNMKMGFVPFDMGFWKGIDGNVIFAAINCEDYNGRMNAGDDLSESNDLIVLSGRNPYGIANRYYGTGDTGGSPTIESVHAVQNSLDKNGTVKVYNSPSDRIFRDFLPFDKHPEVEVYEGELTMDVHGTGCYTSQAAMKLFNRRNELLADAAERSAVMADWAGLNPYPARELTEGWKRFLWHQFHDDLTGTSIPRAYEFSWNDEIISLKQFSSVLETGVGAMSNLLDTKVPGTPVVIYNPSGFDRIDIVCAEGIGETIYDQNGRRVPSQKGKDGKVYFVANVPACGFVVYSSRDKGTYGKTFVKVSGNTIENSVYVLKLDANGDIASIIDKRNGKELVENGKSFRLAFFGNNESTMWPAWEILKNVVDSEPASIDGNVRISIAESGPVKGSIKVEREYAGSRFIQYICLYEGADADRIDIVNDIEWGSTGALLKAEFPLSFSNSVTRYDIGLGSVERPVNLDHQYEVYGHQWADLCASDGSYGVSVLNDCKYGWDKPAENVMRLTLLHTPRTAGNYSYQDHQDFGHHSFTYSIVGHPGKWNEAGIVKKAEALNQPLKAFVTPAHKGCLGRSFSFVKVSDNIELRAVKKAEDSDAYVLRFYETSGKSVKGSVTFASSIKSLKELNGNEKFISDLAFTGNGFELEMGPYAIKTVCVELDKPGFSCSAAVESQSANPEFNFKAASSNSFRREVNADGMGNSYPAELIPDHIDFRGVRFELSDPDLANAVKCAGQTLTLPEGKWNRVYLLMAAMSHDTVAEFGVGGKSVKAAVPYYSSFVGQWGHTDHTESYIKNADVAFVGTHKHNMLDNADVAYEFSYMFCIGLDLPAGVREIKLPADKQILLFSASVADDRTVGVKSVSDLMRVAIPEVETWGYEGDEDCDYLLESKMLCGKSGQINESERAEFAADEDRITKWCDNSSVYPKYLEFDLGATKPVKGWYVMSAGLESPSYITEEYSLQVRNSSDEEWTTVDTVSGNKFNETRRTLSAEVNARYLRLLVTKPAQNGGNVARIYEFNVF